MQSLQGCTPLIPGIRKDREALPSDFGVQGLGLPAKGSIAWRLRKPAENCFPPLPRTHVGWQESLALALSQQMSPFPQCKYLTIPLCSRKIAQAATARRPEEWQCQTFPLPWPTTALIFAEHHCENTARIFTEIKGILLTFTYSSRKAEAHRLCTGSCLVCPDCCHTSAKLPTLEWLFQPWRGLLWKELEEPLWLLLYAN